MGCLTILGQEGRVVVDEGVDIYLGEDLLEGDRVQGGESLVLRQTFSEDEEHSEEEEAYPLRRSLVVSRRTAEI